MSIIIIGAGLSGIGAGLELETAGMRPTILEASDRPGGLAKTDEVNGFYFDRTGHYLHVKTDRGQKDIINATVPLRKIKKKSAIIVGKKLVPYPIQYNLFPLKPSIIKKIIKEIDNLPDVFDRQHKKLSDFFEAHFGHTLTQFFFRPYNEKLWGQRLENLPEDCLGKYFPRIDRSLLLEGCEENTNYQSYNNFFYYPECGKIGAIPEKLIDPIAGNVLYNTPVKQIDLKRHICYDNKKNSYPYKTLITSMPLHDLSRMIEAGQVEINYCYTKIHNIRIIIKGSMLLHYHWLYIADAGLPFYRIGFPQNIMENVSNFFTLSIEINNNNLKPYGIKQVAEMAISYLVKNKLIQVEKTISISSIPINPAYTYIPEQQKKQISSFHIYLEQHDIYPTGRYGQWDYFSMEDAYLSGIKVAKKIIQGMRAIR